MTARFIVGDTRAVTATLPDGSVDFLMCSPPFLALRSYLPADHPDKALEIGSEATPAAFIDDLLDLSAEWRRILAPHGSIVVELGDTYAGSGGGGGDYYPEGMRARQPGYDGSGRRSFAAGGAQPNMIIRDGPGWPRAKSLTLIPEAYRFGLVYGVNPHTGQASPAGRWQVRNVIRWVRPNPPVGALGKKWRPATSELVVACPDDDRRYWDDVATRTEPLAGWRERTATTGTKGPNLDRGDLGGGNYGVDPAGAPLLDWWKITPTGYPGAHYAVYPPELCVNPIEAMCPRRVCTTCGEPSRRETETEYDRGSQTGTTGVRRNIDEPDGRTNGTGMTGKPKLEVVATTTGWSTCGCPGTDGIRLDGYHTGSGWRPGVVFDPFAGTGTTLAVATGHGRDAIGIDLDPRNADLAVDRVGPLMLTVEHLNEPTDWAANGPHQVYPSGHSKFPAGYVRKHRDRPDQAPQAKNYGEGPAA